MQTAPHASRQGIDVSSFGYGEGSTIVLAMQSHASAWWRAVYNLCLPNSVGAGRVDKEATSFRIVGASVMETPDAPNSTTGTGTLYCALFSLNLCSRARGPPSGISNRYEALAVQSAAVLCAYAPLSPRAVVAFKHHPLKSTAQLCITVLLRLSDRYRGRTMCRLARSGSYSESG